MLVGDPGTRDGAVIFPPHRHGETFVFVSFTHSFNKILLSASSFHLVCDVFVLVFSVIRPLK